jgi:hypothetical protein
MLRLLCLVFGLVLSAPAADKMNLMTSCRYEEQGGVVCETGLSFAREFALEVSLNGESVEKAVLRSKDLGGKSIELTAQERSTIQTFVDKLNYRWISTLELSERLALWLLHASGSFYCGPTTVLKSADGAPFKFVFPTEGVGEEIVISHSRIVPFTGTLIDGRTYKVELRVSQRKGVIP